MKKLLLFLALFMAIPMFVGCGDDGNDGEEIEGTLRKSDLYGTWKQVNVTMTINQNGTYTQDGVNKPSLSGTWSFDGYARIWVNHRNDGNSYTNIIHLLNKTTFSYTDQYGNHDIWSRVNDLQEYISPATGTHNGYGYVDLGLSVKWATCNIGASNPSDYGSYFAWGETSTKSRYTKENSKTYNLDMGSIAGNPSYDAACYKWGGSWRLPTKTEMEELKNRCTWTWTTQRGVAGSKVTGPNGNSIFLPAAGYRSGSLHLGYGNSRGSGDFWSATPYDSENAYFLYSLSGGYDYGKKERYVGQSVRPVLD